MSNIHHYTFILLHIYTTKLVFMHKICYNIIGADIVHLFCLLVSVYA